MTKQSNKKNREQKLRCDNVVLLKTVIFSVIIVLKNHIRRTLDKEGMPFWFLQTAE